jgi:hypothetical protein
MRQYKYFALLPVLLSTGLHGARAEDEEDEEEDIEPNVMASMVFGILTAMVVASVLFEVTKDRILETTRKELLPVITSLYGELTVLGFIGLTLFIVGQLKLMEEVSEEVFGEGEFIGELCESVHMVLFLVMLIFMATVVGLIQVGNTIASDWKHWESDILEELSLAREYNAIKSKPQCSYKEPLAYQKIAYAALRKHFLRDLPNDIADGFDFSGYLIPLLGETISEVVEIPVSTWVTLEVFIFVVWQLKMILNEYEMTCFIIAVGYALPFFMRCIQFKLRAIKADVLLATKSLIKATAIEESSGNNRAVLASESTPLQATAGQPVDRKPSILTKALSLGGGGDGVVHNARCCAPFICPQRYDMAGLVSFYGRTLFDWKHHGERFWLGNWKHPLNPVKEPKEAPEFTLFLVRLCLLLNSIYLAAFVVDVLPKAIQYVQSDEMTAAEFVVMFFIFVIPPLILIHLTPMVLANFTLVSNIQNMRNRRVVEQGIRRLKTRNAFLTLKVIYMMIHGARNKLHEGIEWETTADGKRRHKENTVGHQRPMDSETDLKKKRIVWKQIFNVFDDDGGGTATLEEIRDLMRTTDPTITDEQLASIIKELDSNSDGEIDFEECRYFGL